MSLHVISIVFGKLVMSHIPRIWYTMHPSQLGKDLGVIPRIWEKELGIHPSYLVYHLRWIEVYCFGIGFLLLAGALLIPGFRGFLGRSGGYVCRSFWVDLPSAVDGLGFWAQKGAGGYEIGMAGGFG
jgi:hypothetical protein